MKHSPIYAALVIAFTSLLIASHAVADEKQAALPDADMVLTRIAFGSCARQNTPQPIWHTIVDAKPQLFLFIGDNIYGDSEDMNVLRSKYAQLAAKPGYKKLLEFCPVQATWDDHDFGVNDGGVEYPKKKESQKVFLEFYKEPKNSPRWNREGVYMANTYGIEGKRVQIILLDTRYFRSSLKRVAKRPKGRGPYVDDNDPAKTMLGEAQWKWLEKTLREPAELRIIASSVQVVPHAHGWEYWQNFPLERKRLFKLIGDTKANGVIFISGDRHHAEISKLPTDNAENGAGYPMIDVTSSSLNTPGGKGNFGERNDHRLGDNFGQVNFATFDIDWSKSDPEVQTHIRDIKGNPVRSLTTKLSELKAKK